MISPRAIVIVSWSALLGVATPNDALAQASAVLEVFTPHRAFVDQKVPSAVVQISPHARLNDSLDLVVFLHGWNGSARALMGNLADAHVSAGTPTLFIIPQLAYLQRSGDPGAFSQPQTFRYFLTEVLAQIASQQKQASLTYNSVRSITLVAHSAGYETALAVIEHGGVSAKLKNIVLLDSLYSRPERFAQWLGEQPSGRLLSIFQGRGKTYRMNQRLSKAIKTTLGDGQVSEQNIDKLASVPHSVRALVMQSQQRHGAMPSKHLTPVLRWLWH